MSAPVPPDALGEDEGDEMGGDEMGGDEMGEE